MGYIPVLNDNQMSALRRVVGTNQKINLTTPQKSLTRRLPTYSDEGENTGSSDYQGMFHLGVETETVNGTEKVYLTMDWPESGSSDPTLVGHNLQDIHYIPKSIELTEDSYIYFDYFYQRIIVAGFSQLPVLWNHGDGRNRGMYVELLGKYDATSKTVSQLWRGDRQYNDLDYDNGMFHPFLELDVENNKVKSGKIYLNMDWNLGWGYTDWNIRDVVGYIDDHAVRWPGRVEIDQTVYFLIAYDPVAGMIKTVRENEIWVSNWRYLGYFDPASCTVFSNGVQYSHYDESSGYHGNFTICYDTDGGTVKVQDRLWSSGQITNAGNISVNNVNYPVSAFSGALGGASTMYYYARHRVAQTATSGDEDPDLTEQQKQALRTQIANCDSAIATAQQAINGYTQEISSLMNQRTVAYNAISNAYSSQYSALESEDERHISALNAENRDYDQKTKSENTLNQNNLTTLKSTYDAGVAAENTTHVNNLNNLDPDASDYAQKVEAENARHTEALANLLNTYNTGVTAENTRHEAKLQELLTAHNAAIAAENADNRTNIAAINSTLNTTISAQQTIISGLDSQIATRRGYIQTQQNAINSQMQTKNAACLQLYGVIPASAGVEIVAMPSSQAAQTDQYLYILLGSINVRSGQVGSIWGRTFTIYDINQAYQGAIMAFYRMSSSCQGLL